MTISDDEALRRARLRLAYSDDWDDDAKAFSISLAKLEADTAAVREELAAMVAEARTKVNEACAEAIRIGSDLAKSDPERERLTKASAERCAWYKRNREMLRLRDALRKGEELKKSASWRKLTMDWRWYLEFRRAESVATQRLAALEAEHKAVFAKRLAKVGLRKPQLNRSHRSEMAARAASNRRAMIERGVTFDRMV